MKKILLLTSMMAALFAMPSVAQTNSLAVADITIGQGEKTTIDVTLDNPEVTYKALQFDLQLPQGIDVVYSEDDFDYLWELSTARFTGKTWVVTFVQVNKADNIYRMAVYNTNNKARIVGNSGTLVTFTIESAANIAGGEFTGAIKDQVLTTAEGKSEEPANVTFKVKVATPVGINTVEAATVAAPAFNLMGMKVDANAKGLLIKNGKKMLVK